MGREGPSSELSGSGQAPRAGPAVSTSRHCPREPRSRRKGARRRRRLGPPARPRGPGRPSGPGACAGRARRRSGRRGGGGAAALGPAAPPAAASAAARPRCAARGSACTPGAQRCPGTPSPPDPSMPGECPRPPPGPRPGPAPECGPEAPRPRRGLGLGSARRGTGFGVRVFRVRGLRSGADEGRGPRLARPRSPRRGARLPAGIAGNNKDSGKQRGAVPGPGSPRRTRTVLHGGHWHSRNSSTRAGGVAFCGLWEIGNNLALKPKACLEGSSHPCNRS